MMLGLKALRIRGVMTEEDEKVSPGDIENGTRLKGGSIRPTLSKLVENRLLRIDKESNKYFLPDYSFPKIVQILE
jgi:DNA-binding IclR family transcriptional regulator